jgi:hypothetical protein
VADHARWATLNRRTVILCLRTGGYFGLNETGTRIWQGILDGRGLADIVGDLNLGAGKGATRVSADYAAFTSALLERDLLVASTSPRQPAAAPRGPARRGDGTRGASAPIRAAALLPAAAHAWLCQQRIEWTLRRRGFTAVYAFAARSRSHAAAKGTSLARCLAGFAAAEKFTTRLLRRDDCLPRSLALYLFLRARGFPVRHTVGIADDPLRAHAWVELDGQPLLDDPEHVRRHTAIARLP